MMESESTFGDDPADWGIYSKKISDGLREGFFLCRTLKDGEGNLNGCRIIAVNRAFELLMGVEGKSIEGKPAVEVFPELKEVWTAVCADALVSTEPVHAICRVGEKKRSYEVSAYSPWKDQIVVLFTDITERIKEREEHRRLQSQFFQAQKMEAVGRLAGGVAHDFNNLLTAIRGYADLAILQFNNEPIVKESLDQIQKATDRAAKLSQQLLIFSRKEPMELLPRNLNDLIANLSDMLKRIIGENIAMTLELDPGVPVTRVNQGQIEQVFMNLAVNARDAMPAGGRLTITTKNVEVDDKYCESYSYARPGEFVCLTVEDTGAGMDRETMGQIFEPFFTTKKSGEGTGLGLSVVYGIVHEHDGWINVFSEPGKGSVFNVYLPACLETVVRPKQQPPVTRSLRGNGERILLVEDEKTILNFMKKRLLDEGYVVFTAENVSDASKIYESEKSAFDLLFTDIVLPDRSGVELIDKLYSKNPRLKVLLTSGYLYNESEWPSLKDVNPKFIQKPYTVNGLLLAIRSSIDEARGG